MKKTISFLLSLLFVLSFASCGKEEAAPVDYISEGMKTQLKMLVMANLNFNSSVYTSSTLKADDSNPVEKDGVKWLPVKDSRFTSYDDFLISLNAVYTSECIEKILEDYDYYADIDGVFCIKADAVKSQDSEKWEMDASFNTTVVSKKDDKISVRYNFIKGKQTKKQTYTFVNTSSGYRLDKFYKLG